MNRMVSVSRERLVAFLRGISLRQNRLASGSYWFSYIFQTKSTDPFLRRQNPRLHRGNHDMAQQIPLDSIDFE